MPDAMTPEQVRAEVQQILDGEPAAPAARAPAAEPTAPAPDPAAAGAPVQETPPAETPPAPVATPAPSLDPQTQQKIAFMRQQAQAERQRLNEERAKYAEELKAVEEYRRAKALGDPLAAARALGLQPGREHAELLLAEQLGKDAPEGLQLRAMIAKVEQQRAQDRAEFETKWKTLEEEKQRFANEQQQQANRQYLRSTLIPQLGDRVALLRAISANTEFGDGLLNNAIQQYQDTINRNGEADPAEVFANVDQQLERMVSAIAQDKIARGRLRKLFDTLDATGTASAPSASASASPKPEAKPAAPADKKQPATTIDNSFSSKTAPPADPSDHEAFLEQVRNEARALLEGRTP